MLHQEKLAKQYVAVLARELETSTDPVIRNNVVVIMCDLCVRYPLTCPSLHVAGASSSVPYSIRAYTSL